jgi:pimeloyl-ACP methyl ester carboxylesterase
MLRAMARPTLGGAQLWADVRWKSGWRVQRHALTGHYRLLDPSDRAHASGSLATCEAALARLAEPSRSDELVVVLHGLGRSRRAMARMSRALEGEGFEVASLDYASTRRTLAEHANDVLALLDHVDARRVSFVTHSLGGLVARTVLAHPRFPSRLQPHRLVMCAPPSRGASLARVLHANARPVVGAVFGPVLAELAKGPVVPLPTVPFLIVAGAKGARLNPLLDGPDDGVVTVEETKLEGMHEHLVVDAIHTFVMQHPKTIAAAKRFLRS